jgi:hypothetical protein
MLIGLAILPEQLAIELAQCRRRWRCIRAGKAIRVSFDVTFDTPAP